MSFDKFQLLSMLLATPKSEATEQRYSQSNLKFSATTRNTLPSLRSGDNNISVKPCLSSSGLKKTSSHKVLMIKPSASTASILKTNVNEDGEFVASSIMKMREGNFQIVQEFSNSKNGIRTTTNDIGSPMLLSNSNRLLRESPDKLRHKNLLPSAINSGVLKPYETMSKNFGIRSKDEFFRKFKAVNDQLSPLFDSQRISNTREKTYKNIIAFSKTKEKQEDPLVRRVQIQTDFTPALRKNWSSPLSSYQKDQTVGVKVPRKIPNLILSATRTQAVSSARQQDPDRENNESQQNSIHKRGSSEPLVAQFSYDKNSFVKYMVEFVKLVQMTMEIKNTSNNDVSESVDQKVMEEQYKNVVQILNANSPEDLFPNIKEMQTFVKSQSIYLCVLKEPFEYIFKDRKKIASRILRALDIDHKHEFTQVNWEHYLQFMKILIHQEAPRPDLSNFVLRFFKGKEKVLTQRDTKKILNLMVQEYEEGSPARNSVNEFIEILLQSWEFYGIMNPSSEYINAEGFKDIYSHNKLNIYSLMKLITHRFST